MSVLRRACSLILGMALTAIGQVVLTPSAFSTQQQGQPNGLGWGFVSSPTVTSQNYTGVSITASGGQGIAPSTPYIWTINDNGNIVQTCSASKCTTPAFTYIIPATHDGLIDASGDATGDNATVIYYAPIDFPDNLALQICATDHAVPTPSTTCSTATIPTGAFPSEMVKRRARMLGMNNQPWTIWGTGSSPTVLQSSLSYFPNPVFPGTWMGFEMATNISINSPVTAGSAISRPSWSSDGHRYVFGTVLCQPLINCPVNFDFLQNADGSGLQNIHGTYGYVDSFTWDVNRPSWMLMENENNGWPSPATGRLDVWDTANPATPATTVFTYTSTTLGCNGSPCEALLFSQMGGVGNSRNFLKESNYVVGSNTQQCSPVATCVGGGNGPVMRDLDLSGCEANLTVNCVTVLSTFNLNLGLGNWTSGSVSNCDGAGPFDGTSSYYDINGNPHQVNACEAGAHDITYRRGFNQIIFNYGPRGGAGELMFFSMNDNGTGPALFYADQTATNNRPYMGHPTWGANGLVVYGGSQYCNATSVSSPCTDNTSGIGWWNPALDGHCTLNPTFPACGLVQFVSGLTYGHSAWDGYNLGLIAHDDGGATIVGGFQHEVMWESLWTPARESEQELFDWGNRPEQFATGDVNFSIISGPVQSPDGTKVSESIPTTVSQDSAGVNVSNNVWFQVGTPQAPVRVVLASNSSAEIQWLGAPLGHETEKFWIYKQPSCSGSWTQLASVNAVYEQSTPYSYTDSALVSGSACYGVSAEEWSGQESGLLSNVIGVTDTGGVFSVTSTSPAGDGNFHTSAPGAVTGFTATQAFICASGCASANKPSAPTVSAGTGGSLASGTYQAEVSYVKWADFPVNTVAQETLASLPTSVVVAASGTLTINSSISEMVGQDAVRVYIEAPGESTFTLRSTITIPDYANGNGSNFASAITHTYSTLPAPGVTPPNTNTAVGGNNLAWMLPSDPDLRFVVVFSREGSAPPNANPWTYEVAAIPASATSFYDAFPNLEPAGDVFYMLKTMDTAGNLSVGVCYDATSGTSVGCS